MDVADMILVSVDDHVVEAPSMYEFFRDHLPAKFKDRAPRVIRRPERHGCLADRRSRAHYIRS